MQPNLSPLVYSRIEWIINDGARESDVGDVQYPICSAFYNDVQPVIQNGPQCGLVALKMAGQFLADPPNGDPVSVNDIFQLAREAKFTENGEMFSAEWLKELALKAFSSTKLEATRVSPFPSATSLIQSVSAESLILVPYDTDKNHQPCTNKGHTAHWCLLTGVLIVSSSETYLRPACSEPDTRKRQLAEGFREDPKFPCLRWRLTAGCDDPATEVSTAEDQVYFFAFHGKSKHPSLFAYDALRASNQNLREIGEKRLGDELTYVLPPNGGVKDGLADQIVILRKK